MPALPCNCNAIGPHELRLVPAVYGSRHKSHAAAEFGNRNNALTRNQRDVCRGEVSARGAAVRPEVRLP